jgi:lipoprotein NlpI
LNDFEGALQDYDKSIALDSTKIDVYNNRSILRCSLRDYKGTIEDYNRMIELNPSDEATIKNRKIIQSLIDNPSK